MIRKKTHKKYKSGSSSLNTFPSFLLASPTLPPDQNGQAIMLYRILDGLTSSSYRTISPKINCYSDQIKNKMPSLNNEHFYFEYNLKKTSIGFLKPIFKVYNFFSTIKSSTSQIIRTLKKHNDKILIACTGDSYIIPASFIATYLTGSKLIIYCFDDYLHQFSGLLGLITKFYFPIILRRAKAVIVPNEFLQIKYRNVYKANSQIVRNPISHTTTNDAPSHIKTINEPGLKIVFTGSVYEAHYDAFRKLIDSVQALNNKTNQTKHSSITNRTSNKLRSVGKFSHSSTPINIHVFTAQDKKMLAINGLEGRDFYVHKFETEEKTKLIREEADILFLPLAFHSPYPEIIRTSAPGKIGEYLTSGRPILVYAPRDSFISWFFQEHNCGLVINEEDQGLLSSAILKLVTDKNYQSQLVNNSKSVASKYFDVNVQRQKLIEVITSI